MRQLDGKIAIVTGAGQGIGRAIALGMAREGAAVVIAEIRPDAAAEVRAEAERLGARALAVPTDVSQEDSVATLARRCVAEFGAIDILVNNAGIYTVSAVDEMSEAEWDRIVDTNLVGAFLCSRAVVPEMRKKKNGRIISISSGIAYHGAGHVAHYAASKAGLIGMTKALALELATSGITVNAICPGITDTALVRGHRSDEELSTQAQGIPWGRIGRVEDHVGPAVFLASDAARFITGQAILVNGGATMV